MDSSTWWLGSALILAISLRRGIPVIHQIPAVEFGSVLGGFAFIGAILVAIFVVFAPYRQ